jgi:hypothetical protein
VQDQPPTRSVRAALVTAQTPQLFAPTAVEWCNAPIEWPPLIRDRARLRTSATHWRGIEAYVREERRMESDESCVRFEKKH